MIYQDPAKKPGSLTRGDGFVGEDVTANIRTIESIPLTLRNKKGYEQFLRGRTEIRGEIVMYKADFKKLNDRRAKEGKPLTYASVGIGSFYHLLGEQMSKVLGVPLTHVPYKGGPEAITAVLKGETCCIMNQVQTVMSHYKADKVRLLGVTTLKRVSAVQEVPTIAESGLPGASGFDSSIWFGLFAPKGTDARVVARLNEAKEQQ